MPEGVRGGLLDDLPLFHDQNPIGEIAHHRQVVGDKQIGQAQLFAQLYQQVKDLRLGRHIQRRHRLVADHQPGLEDQRPGNADTLALATGELVGQTRQTAARKTDGIQHCQACLLALSRVVLSVQALYAVEKGLHAVARVERGVGVLKDHLHLTPPAQQRFALEAGDITPGKFDTAAAGGQQAQQGAAEGRLAAARFANQPHALALAHFKADAVEHGVVAVARGQLADLEQRRVAGGCPRLAPRSIVAAVDAVTRGLPGLALDVDFGQAIAQVVLVMFGPQRGL